MQATTKRGVVNLVHAGNGLGAATVAFGGVVPPEEGVMILFGQVLLAKALPSFLGVGHKVLFKNDQITGLAKALVVGLLALFLASTPVMARDSVELVFGQPQTNGEGVADRELDDVGGDTYGIRYLSNVGPQLEDGRVAWDIGANVERLDLDKTETQNGELETGAWCLDGLVRVKFGRPRAHGYVDVGMGGIFSDVEAFEQVVTVRDVDSLNPSGHRVEEAEVMAMVQTVDQTVGITYSGSIGFRAYLDPKEIVGVFVEYTGRWGLAEGATADSTTGVRFGVTLPGGP